MSVSKNIHFSLLDGARFFAAFWVMNFHYFFWVGPYGTFQWYRYGNLGVQLFFIISGFVIVQSLQGKTLKAFATSRFIRLFPLFWVLCTITYVLTLVIPHDTARLVFTEYVRSMTMLGDVFNGVIGTARLIDPSYWTLTIELIFYIGIGLFVFLFSYKNIRYFLAGWLIVSALTYVFHIDDNFYIKLLLVRHASYFIFGSALALITMKQAKHVYEKYFDRILLVLSALFSLAIHVRGLPSYMTPRSYDNTVVTIILMVFFIAVPILVYLSRYIKNPRIINGLIIAGGITYPLYLIHQTIGTLVINYVTSTYHVPRNIMVLLFEVLMILTAYILFVQDKKVRRWLTGAFS